MAEKELRMNFLGAHKWKTALLALVVGVGICLATREEEKVWVSVAAAHYLPPNQRVDEFYVDRRDYGNTSFDGYAGMGVCCVWLPKRWRPGIVVDVRWVVGSWIVLPVEGKARFDYKPNGLVGTYRAKVPVERYEEAEDVFVHFFEGGKVRVVPGVLQFRDKADQVGSVEKAARAAISGEKVSYIFTEQEQVEIEAASRKVPVPKWR